MGGGGRKCSWDGDQCQEYQRGEEGPYRKLRCDACGKWVGGLLRHAFEEHSACWVCHMEIWGQNFRDFYGVA